MGHSAAWRPSYNVRLCKDAAGIEQCARKLILARNEGPDVVHLPYTPEFEAVCQRINPAATIEDKHGIWEKLLALREVAPSPAEAVPSRP